jgi:hypothetical protein
LYRYQNKVLAKWAVCICLKRKEIARGKKGKTSEEDAAFRRTGTAEAERERR